MSAGINLLGLQRLLEPMHARSLPQHHPGRGKYQCKNAIGAHFAWQTARGSDLQPAALPWRTRVAQHSSQRRMCDPAQYPCLERAWSCSVCGDSRRRRLCMRAAPRMHAACGIFCGACLTGGHHAGSIRAVACPCCRSFRRRISDWCRCPVGEGVALWTTWDGL